MTRPIHCPNCDASSAEPLAVLEEGQFKWYQLRRDFMVCPACQARLKWSPVKTTIQRGLGLIAMTGVFAAIYLTRDLMLTRWSMILSLVSISTIGYLNMLMKRVELDQ